MIHRLNELSDLTKSVDREMHPPIHHLEDPLELQEILALRRAEWICFEERHDHIPEIEPSLDLIAHQVLAVIVVSSIAIDLAASEEVPDQLQNVDTAFALNDKELWLHLPATTHPAVLLDRAAETAFTVDEADDPLLEFWPFLLIARTRRIVTNHEPTIPRGYDIDWYREILGFPSK